MYELTSWLVNCEVGERLAAVPVGLDCREFTAFGSTVFFCDFSMRDVWTTVHSGALFFAVIMGGLSEIFVNTVVDEGRNEGSAGC